MHLLNRAKLLSLRLLLATTRLPQRLLINDLFLTHRPLSALIDDATCQVAIIDIQPIGRQIDEPLIDVQSALIDYAITSISSCHHLVHTFPNFHQLCARFIPNGELHLPPITQIEILIEPFVFLLLVGVVSEVVELLLLRSLISHHHVCSLWLHC